MKNFLFFLPLLLLLNSCATTIPMQANLSDQTLLLAQNKNIKPVYELTSLVQDGPLTTINVQKNGTEYKDDVYFEYSSETAFKKIWSSYFQAKFNSYSSDEMIIKINLEDLYMRNSVSTSIAGTLLTGNTKYNAEAIAIVMIELEYKGEMYQTKFEVSSSDYNECQTSSIGGIRLSRKLPIQLSRRRHCWRVSSRSRLSGLTTSSRQCWLL